MSISDVFDHFGATCAWDDCDGHEPIPDWSWWHTIPESVLYCGRTMCLIIGEFKQRSRFPITCDSWDCRRCGPSKAKHLLARLHDICEQGSDLWVGVIAENSPGRTERMRKSALQKARRTNARARTQDKAHPPYGALVVQHRSGAPWIFSTDNFAVRGGRVTCERLSPAEAYRRARHEALVAGLVAHGTRSLGSWRDAEPREPSGSISIGIGSSETIDIACEYADREMTERYPGQVLSREELIRLHREGLEHARRVRNHCTNDDG